MNFYKNIIIFVRLNAKFLKKFQKMQRKLKKNWAINEASSFRREFESNYLMN